MSHATFCWESVLPYPAPDVFAWHTRTGAFERFNPPWRPVHVLKAPAALTNGNSVTIKLPLFGSLGIRWHLVHREYKEGVQFCDEQTQGPFRRWKHLHTFIAEGPSSCRMRDEVYFELPRGMGVLTPLLTGELQRLFRFRHMVLSHDLALHARWKEFPRKRILISGSSGFIGSALTAFLSTAGHTVIRLVRHSPQLPNERMWAPDRNELDPSVFKDIDVVIHLGGENLLAKRWNEDFKRKIKESRVQTSTLLGTTISNLSQKPELVIMASATGFYGNTGETSVDETSPPGKGFLAETCQAWESSIEEVLDPSVRLVFLRIGTVLNARGGALKKMLPVFKLGAGGTLGSGTQYMSWIALQDLLGIFEHAIYTNQMRGPFNAVSPEAVTNKEFTKALGKAVHRPAFAVTPAPLVRLLFGEVADETLLASSRVYPKALLENGYFFQFPHLSEALQFEV